MASKKPNIMSLSVNEGVQARLKKIADKRNLTVSQMMRDVIDKHFGTGEEDVDTIILKVPRSMRQNPEELAKWLKVRFDWVLKKLA
jgi:predicted DNA-binding ribbon-helix-helix protein